uniref:Variant surface glycoprotein 1711 n=1 Tax=Trypanosoma brucei TaxID=5691 RepID=M4SX20_9TRYP|nr:variant surface glycoprotein 1711 [Trypanosoma brucei]
MRSFSPGALLSLLLILTGVTTSHAAAPAAGDNIASYNQLCRMVRLAAAEIATPNKETDADDFETIATIVNLTASDPTALDDIANHNTKEYSSLPTTSKAKMHCTENTWDLCKKAAAYARDHKDNRQLQQWSKEHYSQQTATKIQDLVSGIIATVDELRKIDLAAKATAVNTNLAEALLGPTKAKSRIELQTSSTARAAMCGKTDSSADSTLIAGKFIAADMLCICGQAISGNTQPAICGTFDPPPNVEQQPGADYWNDWQKFRAGCGPAANLDATSGNLIRSAICIFLTHIRGNAGAVAGKLLRLGQIPTSLTSHSS